MTELCHRFWEKGCRYLGGEEYSDYPKQDIKYARKAKG